MLRQGRAFADLAAMWLFPIQRLPQIAGMFRQILIPLAMSLTIAAAALAPAQAAPSQVINIDSDSGGNVLKTIQRRNELAASGKLVRIRGYCRSACTIYLTLPNACLGPLAEVGFHAPRIAGTKFIPPYVGEMMGRFYRGEIRRRWFAEWQYSLNMHKMSAQEYRLLDPEVRICTPKEQHLR